MSRVLTGNKLIESIRLRSFIPNDTATYTDQDILNVANEEMDVQLLDKLLTLHEEHLTVHVDIPRNDSGVYEIPYRAVGNKIRDVSLISGNQVYELSQISIGELSDFDLDVANSRQDLGRFYIESNHIKIISPSRAYDSIRIYYYLRPSTITKTERAATISTINIGTNDITFNLINIPSFFTGSLSFDIVAKRTPNKVITMDLSASSLNSNLGVISFPRSVIEPFLSEIRVGDYVCLAEESPVANIPTEMHPLLAQLAAVNILESLNDTEGLANAEKKLNKMINSVTKLVDARVELAPKKIKPRHGTLQQSIGIYPGKRGRGR
jgi:sporulation protein YlmC with PRC-barrel domain